mmetsp:Transcript_37206/g.111105  ORF Transcript_37206/g.111105 Transcript_37206/m.111105 type:complete len:236 (+) Transcript_37206:1451-2158(+)
MPQPWMPRLLRRIPRRRPWGARRRRLPRRRRSQSTQSGRWTRMPAARRQRRPPARTPPALPAIRAPPGAAWRATRLQGATPKPTGPCRRRSRCWRKPSPSCKGRGAGGKTWSSSSSRWTRIPDFLPCHPPVSRSGSSHTCTRSVSSSRPVRTMSSSVRLRGGSLAATLSSSSRMASTATAGQRGRSESSWCVDPRPPSTTSRSPRAAATRQKLCTRVSAGKRTCGRSRIRPITAC